MIENNKICDNPECEKIIPSAICFRNFHLCEDCACKAYEITREELWKRILKGSIEIWYKKTKQYNDIYGLVSPQD